MTVLASHRPGLLAAGLLAVLATLPAAAGQRPEVQNAADAVRSEVVQWRRDFHQHPELSNREVADRRHQVAEHLRELGLQPRTGIGHHGVVAIIKGGKPGPNIALRADMDALPVTERTGLPFASKATADLPRRDRRRDARLRPRRAHRHPDGRGRSAGRDAATRCPAR